MHIRAAIKLDPSLPSSYPSCGSLLRSVDAPTCLLPATSVRAFKSMLLVPMAAGEPTVWGECAVSPGTLSKPTLSPFVRDVVGLGATVAFTIARIQCKGADRSSSFQLALPGIGPFSLDSQGRRSYEQDNGTGRPVRGKSTFAWKVLVTKWQLAEACKGVRMHSLIKCRP